MLYTVASVTAGLILPRLEHAYFAGYNENISVGSAVAFFSSVSSGMMALTGIVFAIAFVLVQFSEDCGVAVSLNPASARRRARLEGLVQGISRASEARARLGFQCNSCSNGAAARSGEYRQDSSRLRHTRHPRRIALDCIGVRHWLDARRA